MSETERADVSETEQAAWPERTPLGAAWRGAVVLVFTVTGIPAAAWLATKLTPYEPRFGSGPPIVLGMIVVALFLNLLRARDWLVLAPLWSILTAGFAGSYVLDKGYVSLHRPYLTASAWPTVSMSLVGVGFAAAVVSVVWGTVSGYRRPRPFKPKKEA
ncbi:hypothetical protein AB0I77_32915 [Streptomyces sp. NPDC050619]|uniref:hypothetical protein n=1 Tax=Streptomyces sp. NPDC050619 TaxID=3157214 RepID=UPI003426C7DB